MSAAPPAALEAEDLTRHYGDTVALEGLHLTVEPGEIVGLLGPNGAGKTTTLRLLLGLVRPTRGRCRLLGLPPSDPRARARVGYLPGDPGLDPSLSALQMLALVDAVRLPGAPAADPDLREQLCERLALAPRDRRRRLRELSRGTLQKVALVAALQHDPELLVLDEPTTALDPLVRDALFELLAEAAARGRAILHSSHVLSEVERTCSRVVILRDGRLVASGEVDTLRASLTRRMVVRFAGPAPVAELGLPGVTVLASDGQQAELAVAGELDPLLAVLARHSVQHLAFPEPDLDEAFVLHYREAAGRGAAPARGRVR